MSILIMQTRSSFIIASIMGFSAIALGAFGAHALQAQLSPKSYAIWQTAAHYHLVHAVALFALAIWRLNRAERLAFRFLQTFWTMGILLFSGSLYMLATGAPRFLGAITPVGGILFMLGWMTVGIIALRDDGSPEAMPKDL